MLIAFVYIVRCYFDIPRLTSKRTMEFPKELPFKFSLALILNTKFPVQTVFQLIEEISISNFDQPFKKRFVKSFVSLLEAVLLRNQSESFLLGTILKTLPYHKHYVNAEEFWNAQDKAYASQRVEFLRMLNSPKFSYWIIYFIPAFKIRLAPPIPDCNDQPCCSVSETTILLERLYTEEAYMEYASLISSHNLHDLVDMVAVVYKFVEGNHIQILNALTKSSNLPRVIAIIEDECHKYLTDQSYQLNRFRFFSMAGKVANKLLKAPDNIKNYPAAFLSFSIPVALWMVNLIKPVINTPGNPLFDTNEICLGYVDRIEFFLLSIPEVHIFDHPKKPLEMRSMLFKLTCDKLYGLGLSIYGDELCNRFDDQYVCKRQPSNLVLYPVTANSTSTEYYTSVAEIHFIDSKEKVSELIDYIRLLKIKIVSIDCEWTNVALSICQLCVQFSNDERQTYILDMISLKEQDLMPLLEMLWRAPLFIGFSCQQDFSKIHAICPLIGTPDNLFDISHVKLQDFGMPLTKKGLLSLDIYTQMTLKKSIDKRPRMTCWEKRPLRSVQLLYAAGDVEVLLDIFIALQRINPSLLPEEIEHQPQ
ncbi:ribonuclease H-like domain-containing protein [Globomyces pollinis-pini]|nr:ribonuclease H-like domain-containing protein [Globomyces pollinis-pini]